MTNMKNKQILLIGSQSRSKKVDHFTILEKLVTWPIFYLSPVICSSILRPLLHFLSFFKDFSAQFLGRIAPRWSTYLRWDIPMHWTVYLILIVHLQLQICPIKLAKPPQTMSPKCPGNVPKTFFSCKSKGYKLFIQKKNMSPVLEETISTTKIDSLYPSISVDNIAQWTPPPLYRYSTTFKPLL